MELQAPPQLCVIRVNRMADKMRVHILAKELNVSSKSIIDKCRAEGVDSVKNHMSTLSAGLHATIREWFSDYRPTESLETATPIDLTRVRLKRNRPDQPLPKLIVHSPVPSQPLQRLSPLVDQKLSCRDAGVLETVEPEEALDEATRLFLSGYYRAAFIQAVAALESKLKRYHARQNYAWKLDNLISALPDGGPLGDVLLKGHLNEFRRTRNELVHQSASPSPYLTQIALFSIGHTFQLINNASSSKNGLADAQEFLS
jgi:hypothetical protein